ncbi:putative pelota protein [Spraguea lophii 42_110]|uniref:Putative pelota protein n=1 Tax=Spraguea lophii (strain 42_110) TaxID=1358809 RepID=S7WEG5_SPRLO|nr:putative pelota protein [Spraguea lophii 42_110]
MKIIKENIDMKHKCCKLEYIPEHSEDICRLYDIIEYGDIIRSFTYRKVAVTAKDQKKIRLLLEMKVEKVDVDLEASVLFIGGITNVENEYVKIGSHHTFKIGVGDRLCIMKSKINDISMKFIRGVKESLCEILFLMENKNEVEIIVFNNNFYKTLKRVKVREIEKEIKNINISDIKLLVLINFKKDINTTYKYINVKIPSEIRNNTNIIEFCLKDKKISKQIENTQFYKNFKNMENFIKQQHSNENMVSIGIKEVKESMEYAAIKILIFSSNLIKTIEQKKEIEKMVKELKNQKAEVSIIPHTHPLGMKLEDFGGMVAVLKFQHRFN